MVKNYNAKVVTKDYINPNLVKLELELPEVLDFLPGQFFSLKLDSARRSYSISNIPHTNVITTYVDLNPGGPGSIYINNLVVGQDVSILAPLGAFVYNSNSAQVTFVATGTGFTPFLSMIKHELLNLKTGASLKLIYGVRYQEYIAILPELEQLKLAHKNFDYLVTISRPTANWQGHTGRVTEYLNTIPQNSDVYICGGAKMIFDVNDRLLANGFKQDQIKYEQFY